MINMEYNYQCGIAIIETIQMCRNYSDTSAQTKYFKLI